MNHVKQCQLMTYMSHSLKELDDTELEDYQWLIEELLLEVRQAQVAYRPAVSDPN